MKKNKQIIFRTLFFSATIAIIILAVLPSDKLTSTMKISDILNHTMAFLTLSFLFRQSFPHKKNKVLFIYLSAYGGLIELIQFFLPWRSCDLKDLSVDITAILAFIIISEIFKKGRYIESCQ